ncbi:caspase recruitment domain-containing protein 9 isoform X3 [Sminthopsis crassicaudata]|uniref:caspase recruitment domain-containing protein 9 isoform X3 n=1 Tax=Sminthopsis crassicaudata TaxID=9301 RepID=UPI003D695017
MSDYENDEECWNMIESFRVKLISIIDPSRITPYLRQCKVINLDDEEQVLNDPNLVIRKRKVGVLLDILQRTGHRGYVAFLESLELYYPQLYKKVTGKEPTRVFSMIIDASGESGLTQLLMNEVMKLQKKVQDLNVMLSAKDDFIKEVRVKDSMLRKHQERVQKMKDECESFSQELKRCKDENYDLAMLYARQSEEKNMALMRNRDLQLEIDRLRHNLMKAEDDCKVERKHTMKLRHAMEQRPSQEVMWEIQQEKDLLQAKIQELESSMREGRRDKNNAYIQILEEDWRQALRDHQEKENTIFHLRKELRQAEALRNKAIMTREEFHLQYSNSLKEKDELRKQIRELGEKYDELQLQLFKKEGQVLSMESKLKRLQSETPILSSDLDDSSPRNSQELTLPRDLEDAAQLSGKNHPAKERLLEQPFATTKEKLFLAQNGGGLSNGDPQEKERRRIKESFENYRRKWAHRKVQHSTRQGEVDWENTTGSDNTDTEGS